MRLTFEILLNEKDIGRIVRCGCWILTQYPDGRNEWEWAGREESEEWKKKIYTKMNSTAHLPRSLLRKFVA